MGCLVFSLSSRNFIIDFPTLKPVVPCRGRLAMRITEWAGCPPHRAQPHNRSEAVGALGSDVARSPDGFAKLPPACLVLFAMSAQHAPPAPIGNVSTLDDVVDAMDSIIRWSIGALSRLGYFAALYKRITIGVRTAVAEGAFEDGPRMEQFDVAFANRYFDALNGYFHPGPISPNPQTRGGLPSMRLARRGRSSCSTCWPE